MRVLVVGGAGMLGSDVVAGLRTRGHDVVAPDAEELDITDPSTVALIAAEHWGKLDWCVNCAAYTAVDLAETEKDTAMLVNAIGPGYLSQACGMASVKWVHISTDFVFDGAKREPYAEEDAPNPLGVYALSKLEGERAAAAAVILRTAWLYGPNGKSFPRTILRAWRAGKPLRVVADQVGSPTYTADLARVVGDVLERNLYPGLYHAAGAEAMSWHELATRTVRTYAREVMGEELEPQIEPIATEDWPIPALRPKYSVLSSKKLEAEGIGPMRSIEEALADFVKRLPEEL